MSWKRTWITGAAAACLALAWSAPAAAAEAGGAALGTRLPWWSILPFLGILLSISLFPLFAPHSASTCGARSAARRW